MHCGLLQFNSIPGEIKKNIFQPGNYQARDLRYKLMAS